MSSRKWKRCFNKHKHQPPSKNLTEENPSPKQRTSHSSYLYLYSLIVLVSPKIPIDSVSEAPAATIHPFGIPKQNAPCNQNCCVQPSFWVIERAKIPKFQTTQLAPEGKKSAQSRNESWKLLLTFGTEVLEAPPPQTLPGIAEKSCR